MARIDNREQLHQLELRFAHVQGAIAVAQHASAEAQELVKSYLEAVGLVAGISLGPGDQVTVDWKSGEVHVELPLLDSKNGVAA